MEPGSLSMRSALHDFTNSPPSRLAKISAIGWNASVYLDTDPILAVLKPDDWLASSVDLEAVAVPKTSVATAIEVQYVMESDWEQDQLANAHAAIADQGIELVPLTVDAMEAAATLRKRYERLNVFDAVHLGTADTLDEPIISTDTLYPDIREIEHIDPRNLGDE
ncbi:type II toxin-antitoxin system VapC family toxin [Halopiger djelfimassiliensis]|uniref:type II toxin-antitoxin system VapC family toxin n=1 Tax=Halopiger djelfimassiliensis TaxID=1293047 RepID=UPI002DDC0160|nr:PIN domain-containing protein [Halopiger djelfimassiliensis]